MDNNNLLKHLCHSHISFGAPKDEYENGFVMGTTSTVELKKSKLSPKIINVPCYIDITKGGLIDESDSFVKYLIAIGLFNTGAYYKFGDYFKKDMVERYPNLTSYPLFMKILNGAHRKAAVYDMIEKDTNMRNLLQIALIDYIDNIYPAQREVNGEFQKQLMRECEYFKDVDIDNIDKVREASVENTDSESEATSEVESVESSEPPFEEDTIEDDGSEEN